MRFLFIKPFFAVNALRRDDYRKGYLGQLTSFGSEIIFEIFRIIQ